MSTTHLSYTAPKENSRISTLRLLFACSTLSRTEIAAALNITTAAVTITTKSLLDTGIVIPCEETPQNENNQHRAGRKQSLLTVDPGWKYVLAIEIFTDAVILAVTDLFGTTIAKKNCPAPQPYCDVKKLCSDISKDCFELLSSCGIPHEKLLGAGVSLQGAVDHIHGIAISPYSMNGPVPFKEYFTKELNMPVAVESNVCSVLQSELTFRNRIQHHDNLLLLKWGPGVGSAMAIGGSIYKGYKFQSPEIGHNTFSSGKGIRCRCGRRGCLETVISEQVLIAKINRLISSGKEKALNDLVAKLGVPSGENLTDYLSTDIPSLQKLIRECMEKLVNTVNNAIIILAPDRLLLYGQFFKSDIIFHKFEEMLLERNPRLPKNFCVRSSALDEKPFIGCTSIVLEQILFAENGML